MTRFAQARLLSCALVVTAGMLIASLALTALAGASVSSSRSLPAAKASITSVTVAGTPAKPTITVKGHGLVLPHPNPAISPSNQPLCPKVIPGNAGLDYGTSFYVLAYANGKQTWAAGRYRPKLGELDCIGLIVLSHSTATIRFRLGAAYRAFGYAPIVNGNVVKVVVDGASRRVVVAYR
jgi:hypothetical protein